MCLVTTRRNAGRGGRATTPLILNLNTTRRLVVSLTFRPIGPQGKEYPVPSEQVAGWALEAVWTFRRQDRSTVHTRNQKQEFAIAVTIPTELLLFLAAFKLPTILVHPSNHHISRKSIQQCSCCYGRTDRRTIYDETVAFLKVLVAEFPKYRPPEPRAGHTAAKSVTYSNILVTNIDFATAATANSQRLFLQHLQSIHIFDITVL